MTTEGTTGQQVKTSLHLPSLNEKQIITIPIIMVIAAELLLYSAHLKAGITLHVLTVLLLSLSSVWITESHASRSLQVLALLPILRLLNVSMPVFSQMTLNLYVYIYAPLFVPAYLVIRHQNISISRLGLGSEKLLKYIPTSIIVGGLIAGGEYMTIHAGNLIPDLSLGNILKLSLIMIFFVGFVEELVFRSLLQTRLADSFGVLKGLLIASLLFGVMHSGYGTFYEIIYTSFAGLVLGYMFQKTNSLPLVSLTHGFVNIFLFGIIPLLPYFQS
ncbi:CPBP family intramembrane glutamic endopeptidase [uncultured Methanolobus sp.]|uniref:CPBP family intramembrane glutamic endopeptidase n=1 Tax=uncultured Methanolobus sp. TaxID=218300 RepID=UPI0029C974FD|nr:CPBP family intramembrane glutamic endopeptidase [uncultured Methanolobus sp.]